MATSTRVSSLYAAFALLCASVSMACSSSPPTTVSVSEDGTLTGCEIVTRKCSRCHESERIPSIRASSPRQVISLVNRMRHKRGSNINKPQGRTITQCIVHQKFGQDGLNSLREGDADGS